VCTEFEMLKVKVPKNFLGMVGFSSPRDGPYSHDHSVGYFNMAERTRSERGQDTMFQTPFDFSTHRALHKEGLTTIAGALAPRRATTSS